MYKVKSSVEIIFVHMKVPYLVMFCCVFGIDYKNNPNIFVSLLIEDVTIQ